jgi:Peptidase family M28
VLDPPASLAEPNWLHRGVLVIALVIGALCAGRYRAPAPRDGPPETFSAFRAFDTLRRIVPTSEPRPLASAENARARERIVAEVERLGLRAEVQSGFTCGPVGLCGPAHNVVAQVGEGSGPIVLLAAHYDSVPTGPGIADDAAGVAVLLEVARALLARGQTASPVVFLFTDGEEAGLIGAQLFADSHPLAKRVKALVNLEARGVSGPSILFESTPNNSGVIEAVAAAVPRPVANSIFGVYYATTRYGTDLSALRELGLSGVNFAFVEGAAAYHTSSDTIDHLSLASVQHHGETTLALATRLASTVRDLDATGAVYFDVLALFVVHWPLRANGLVAFGGPALLAMALVMRVRSASRAPRAVLWSIGLAAFFPLSGLALGALGAWLGGLAVGRGAVPSSLVLLSVAALVTALGAALAGRIRVRPDSIARWFGAWTLWLFAAMGAAILVPAASFPLALPAGFAALVSLLTGPFERRRPAFAKGLLTLAPFAFACLLGFPILTLVFRAEGWALAVPLASAAGLLLMLALPALPLELAAGRRARFAS